MQTFTKNSAPRPFPMNIDFHLGGTEIGEEHVWAERLFGADEPVFEGHFPNNKILPGVVLVEYALYLAERYLDTRQDTRELVELKSATFLSPVLPEDRVGCRCDFSPEGDELLMKAELIRGESLCAKVRARYGWRR
jgi:3-hydroxymyristoyl/3-hydroxydecanoyl-(acyl carrier protein) dehydratase